MLVLGKRRCIFTPIEVGKLVVNTKTYLFTLILTKNITNYLPTYNLFGRIGTNNFPTTALPLQLFTRGCKDAIRCRYEQIYNANTITCRISRPALRANALRFADAAMNWKLRSSALGRKIRVQMFCSNY